MLLWHPKAKAGAPALLRYTGQGTSSHHASTSLIFIVFSNRNVLFRKLCNALFPFFLSKCYPSKRSCFKIDLISFLFYFLEAMLNERNG